MLRKLESFLNAIFGESAPVVNPTSGPTSSAYDIGLAIGMARHDQHGTKKTRLIAHPKCKMQNPGALPHSIGQNLQMGDRDQKLFTQALAARA